MVFGMFMAILDIQIVSASLTEIQAGLSASSNEIAWVQTAYLIAEVVMIPLSGFLSRALGTRMLFAISAAGFTAASLMCGLSSSINEMIFWRAVQGFIGGGMIPTVFATAFTIFPRSKLAIISPMIGLVATLAPTIGPTVGGYLTDALSWHWLFFINIDPGHRRRDRGLPADRLRQAGLQAARQFRLGRAVVDGGLPRRARIRAGGRPAQRLVRRRQHRAARLGVGPLGDAVLLSRLHGTAADRRPDAPSANRNFALGSLFSFVLGIGLYGLTLVYPLYLGQIRGYDALMIGETMFVSGLAMFLTAPIAGRLSAKVDPRFMLLAGFLFFAVGTWWMTSLTRDWDFWELLWPQIFRGVGLMLAMVPINNVALGTLPPDRVKNASGLYNLMRNLGGAVGLAGIYTFLNDRTDLHIARLHETLHLRAPGRRRGAQQP